MRLRPLEGAGSGVVQKGGRRRRKIRECIIDRAAARLIRTNRIQEVRQGNVGTRAHVTDAVRGDNIEVAFRHAHRCSPAGCR